MASAAAEKRGAAIKAISDKYAGKIDAIRELPVDFNEMVEEIRALAALGRTAKFKDAVEFWACMLEDETNPSSWALFQGQIWTARDAGL